MTIPSDRYIRLIEATLRAAMVGRISPAEPRSVSAALPFVNAVLETGPVPPENIDERAFLDGRVIDGAGHSRPLYRGLVLYSFAQLDGGDADVRNAFAQSRQQGFAAFIDTNAPLNASEGSRWIELAFDALAIAGSRTENKVMTELPTRVLGKIAGSLQEDGSFLVRVASDNPEPTWYHELALLHAVTSFACRTGDAKAFGAAQRAATYQAEQIQPDHASSHPFALHAFLHNQQGIYLADMMLHAAGVQQPSAMDAVSVLLLADALDCMRLPIWRE